jgi:prepilin-type N-terminal cleavage/methylation domain-containing protein
VKSNIEHRKSKITNGFTLIEVVAALMILSMILTSVMAVIIRITESMIDLRSQTQAFAVVRQNMETLLSSASVSDASDFGFLEINPDVTWQTVVEPFYEPISKRMWIRGVCTAGYTDSKGQRQTVELSCWLTGLTAAQIRQILAQQKQIEKLLEEFSKTEYGRQIAERHQINLAFLRDKGLETEGYKNFTEQIERRRMDYIAQYGIDKGYNELSDELAQEEFDFIYRLGVNYDEYVNFYENYNSPQGPYSQADQSPQDQPAQSSDTAMQEQPAQNSETAQPDQMPVPDETTDSGNMPLPDGIPEEILRQLEGKL